MLETVETVLAGFCYFQHEGWRLVFSTGFEMDFLRNILNGCPNVGDGSVVLPQDVDDNPKKKHDVIDPDMLIKSVEFFDLMANVALEAGVGIDVFCAGGFSVGYGFRWWIDIADWLTLYYDMAALCRFLIQYFFIFITGANELGLPAYQSLVDPSGGYVVPQLSFATPQFEMNLTHLLEQTYLANSKYDVAAESDDPPEVYLDIRSDRYVNIE